MLLAIVNVEVHRQEKTIFPWEFADAQRPEIVEGFKNAAENAKITGCDGVEAYEANEYSA